MSIREPDFDPAGYLKFAEDIINDSHYDRVTRLRVSVGRSYYAAFIASRDKLKKLGESYDPSRRVAGDQGEHGFVINRLTTKDWAAGDILSKLKEKRVDADYHMGKPVGPDSAKRSVFFAKQLMAKVASLK